MNNKKRFKKNGKGKKYYKNGEIYEGDWKNNVREGQGSMKFKDGKIYKGTWSNDAMNGFG